MSEKKPARKRPAARKPAAKPGTIKITGAVASTDHQAACPKCGYCPHCGRSNPPPVSQPWPYPITGTWPGTAPRTTTWIYANSANCTN